MRTEIDLGCSPSDEECAQVGADNYLAMARKECRAYAAQLVRLAKSEGYDTDLVELRVRSNPHDYGSYYSVVAIADEENEKSVDLAFWLENNSPNEWDDEARKELGIVFEEVVWECDHCRAQNRKNARGEHAVFTWSKLSKRYHLTPDADDERADEEELTQVDGANNSAVDLCSKCVEEITEECAICETRFTNQDGEGYPWPTDDSYDSRWLCSDSCYTDAEHKEGEDCWTNYGERDSQRFLLTLADDDDELADALWEDSDVRNVLASYFECSRGYHGSFQAPDNLTDISRVLGKEEEDMLARKLPPPCTECGKLQKRLQRMQEIEGLPQTAPLLSDDKSWGELLTDHEEGCQWYATRGFRQLEETT